MDKCIAQRVDIILKAAGAKGIGHYPRSERCRLLGLGEPKSNKEANKLLKAWLEQFSDSDSQTALKAAVTVSKPNGDQSQGQAK